MITMTFTTALILGIGVSGALTTALLYAVMKETENNALRAKNRDLQREMRKLKHSAPRLGYDAATGTHYITAGWREGI